MRCTSGVEHPHAALGAVHGPRVDVRVAAVLAGDARPRRARAGSLGAGEAERVAALEDAPEDPAQEAVREPVGVATGPAAAPANASTASSSDGRATICNPTGIPPASRPHGTDAIGNPVRLSTNVGAIQSTYVCIGLPAIESG